MSKLPSVKLNYKLLSILFIISFGFFVIILATVQDPLVMGECGTYTLETASLQYGHTIYITEKSLEDVKLHFPNYYDVGKRVVEGNHFPRNNETGERVNVSWYFPAYSFTCIPISYFLSFLGFNQSYSFALTNAFLLIFALLMVLRHLKNDCKTKFILLLALGVNPIVYYVAWASAEVFIYTFAVMSMLSYFNKAYKMSAFFLTIAASMNITIIALAPFITITYLIELYKPQKNKKGFLEAIFSNSLEILKYGASFSFIIISFVYNYIASAGCSFLSPQGGAISSYGGIKLTLQRFTMYLIDLNFGILPWFPMIFISFIIVIVFSLIHWEYQYIFPAIGYFAVTLGFSLINHINCGMSGIARYNAWASSIMIFIVIIYLFQTNIILSTRFLKQVILKIRSILICLCSIGLIITLIMMHTLGLPASRNANYVDMLPLAQFVLGNFPEIYNPLYSTFISRVEHRDGGYNYSQPVCYFKNENARKILIKKNDGPNLIKAFIAANDEGRSFLETQISKMAKIDNEYFYINIPPNLVIQQNPFYEDENYSMNLLLDDKEGYSVDVTYSPVALQPDTLYKIECIIESAEGMWFNADFYASGGYDLPMSEKTLKACSLVTPGMRYAYINSGDTSIAGNNQIYLRVLNMNQQLDGGSNFPTVGNIKLYELTPK